MYVMYIRIDSYMYSYPIAAMLKFGLTVWACSLLEIEVAHSLAVGMTSKKG